MQQLVHKAQCWVIMCVDGEVQVVVETAGLGP